MNFKKWMMLAMIAAMLLTGLTGCKTTDTVEEGAVTEDYVEGETKTETAGNQNLPTVVPDSGDKVLTAPSQEETEAPAEDPSEETPVEETPKEETPVENQETETPPPEDEEVNVEEGNNLKIVSYNVRCANDGTGKSILERSLRFETVMEEYDPDIMGLQEVVPEWLEYLEESFGDDYEYINRWRAASNKEATPIFWKKSKFKKLDSGYFWLSETPDKESKALEWGADHYRICMWVKLRVKATGKDFIFMNTHFDYKNQTCHVNSAELVTQRATKLGGFSKYAVFCTGDYNMSPNKQGYNKMSEKFVDINFALENDQTPTTNGYNESNGGSIIDYCFYSPDLVKPQKYEVLNKYVLDGYVSDHRGLYIEAALL